MIFTNWKVNSKLANLTLDEMAQDEKKSEKVVEKVEVDEDGFEIKVTKTEKVQGIYFLHTMYLISNRGRE